MTQHSTTVRTPTGTGDRSTTYEISNNKNILLKLLNTCSRNRLTVVVVWAHDECDHIVYRSTNRAALSTVPYTPLPSDVYRQPPPPMFVVHVTRGESEIPDCFLQIQCNIILRLPTSSVSRDVVLCCALLSFISYPVCFF